MKLSAKVIRLVFSPKGILPGLAILSLTCFYLQCKNTSQVKMYSEKPFDVLSSYNFFLGELRDLRPNQRVIPYDLINPLFSDYAEKARFVWIPDNMKIIYNDTSVFDFPDGAVLIKNFYYPGDLRKAHDSHQPDEVRNIIETRLLIKQKGSWDALVYVWNDEQTEAYLELAGDTKEISFIDKEGKKQQLSYSVPNKNQCKSCHVSQGAFLPIGPQARNLNRHFNYADGIKNQLTKWNEAGILRDFVSADLAPALAKWDDEKNGTLNERALAYLEINCAHCHNPSGPAATSGLHLTTTEKNLSNLGFCKSSVAAGKGTGGFLYDIVPGKAEESILFYRINSTDPGVMMPELGRKLIHKEGVELIRQWINSSEGKCDMN